MISLLQIAVFSSFILVLVGLTLHYFQAANAPQREPPALRSYLRALLGEPVALVVAISLAPLSWLSRTLQQAGTGSGPPVVVLSSSLWGSPAPLMGLQWVLWRRGFKNVHAIALPHARGALDKAAGHLIAHLKQLQRAAGGQPIHVITQGSAGLILRFALTEPDLPALGQVVTIGCPHRGTMSAVFFAPQTGLLLRPESPFLCSLPEPPKNWLSIYSEVDAMIIPSDSAKLGRGAEMVSGLGHFQLALSPSVCHMTAEHLLEAGYESSSPTPLEDASRFA